MLFLTHCRARVYGLTAVMSTLMELGLDLPQVIAMTTINPARALRLDNTIGSLHPGSIADISILDLHTGKWRIIDSDQKPLIVTQLLSPNSCIKSGTLISSLQGLGRPPLAS